MNTPASPITILASKSFFPRGRVLWLSIMLFCAGCLCASAQEGERDFTDDQGRVIRAKIVLVRAGKVHLERNKKVFQFPFAKLSEKDQEYVRTWAKANVKYWFLFREKVVADPTKRETSGSGRSKQVRSVSYYNLEVTNSSGVAVKDVTVKYMIAVRRKWGGKSGRRTVFYLDGESVIPSIEHSKSASLDLMDVKLLDAKWQKTKYVSVTSSDGRTYTVKRVYDYRIDYFLDGVWVKLFLGENEIFEYKSKEKSILEAIWGENKYKYEPEEYLKRSMAN